MRTEKEELYECDRCRYMDRPFGYNSSYTQEDCSCTYQEMTYLYITCKRCNGDLCVDCQSVNASLSSDGKRRCHSCTVRYETQLQEQRQAKKQLEHERIWSGSDINGKLRTYGVAKLRILAKTKGLTKYTGLRKEELIKQLAPLVTSADFPIVVYSRVYLNVPFRDKDFAKANGAKWDKERKKWFTAETNHTLIQQYGITS